MKNDLSACACMNLRKTARLIAQFYDRRLQPSGLRTTQFTLLVTLGCHAPVSVTNLAEHLGMDRTTLTRNLRLLGREGLIHEQKGEDARVRMLCLTKKAQALITKTRPFWEKAQSEFLEKFGKRRWRKLHGELIGVTNILAPE